MELFLVLMWLQLQILCSVLLLAEAGTPGNPFEYTGGPRERTQNLRGKNGFPRVYSALLLKPGRFEDDPSAIRFASEVDLINARNTNDPDCVKVSFIVHSKTELDNISAVAASVQSPSHTVGLQVDTRATLDLWEEIQSYAYSDDSQRKLQRYSTIPGFPCYRDLAGTERFMADLVEHASSISNLEVTLMDIGDSYNKTIQDSSGYDIWALKITGNGVAAKGRTTEKGVLFVMSGLHPREYAPTELVARWAEALIEGYANNDAEITSILDHAEVHIVLQANPDGRFAEESHPGLLRRKNLNPSNGNASTCGEGSFGVDLNRNFPFKWGLESGSSADPCQKTYRGSSAASEPEVQAIVNYASSIFPASQRKRYPEPQMDQPYPETTMGSFIDVHSFGEVIIWPWGHVDYETGNDLGFEALADKYAHFNGYDFSGPNNGYTYSASGTAFEWAYGALGAAGVVVELGNAFYQNCTYFEDDILPKNLPALMYAAKVSKAPYSISKGPDVVNFSLSSTSIPSNGQLSITASVSDSAWSPNNFSTSQEAIQEVRVFFDEHPYDVDAHGSSPSGVVLPGNYLNVGNGIATDTFSVALLPLPLVGRHVVYVYATDSDGYTGPVSAASFEVIDPSIKDGELTGVVNDIPCGGLVC